MSHHFLEDLGYVQMNFEAIIGFIILHYVNAQSSACHLRSRGNSPLLNINFKPVFHAKDLGLKIWLMIKCIHKARTLPE